MRKEKIKANIDLALAIAELVAFVIGCFRKGKSK